MDADIFDRLVETESGSFKAIRECTPAEMQSAHAINEQKRVLTARWYALLEELGEDWKPRTPLVMQMGAGRVPAELPLSDLVADVEKIEAVLGMKRKSVGSVN